MPPLIALAAATVAAGGAMAAEDEGPAIAPARDGDVAIRQELEAARRARTLSAYDLFIARHSEHPLARTARNERRRLAERLRRRR